jgi:hypothetical protein
LTNKLKDKEFKYKQVIKTINQMSVCLKDIKMKKLLIGLTLLASMSSFAVTGLQDTNNRIIDNQNVDCIEKVSKRKCEMKTHKISKGYTRSSSGDYFAKNHDYRCQKDFIFRMHGTNDVVRGKLITSQSQNKSYHGWAISIAYLGVPALMNVFKKSSLSSELEDAAKEEFESELEIFLMNTNMCN